MFEFKGIFYSNIISNFYSSSLLKWKKRFKCQILTVFFFNSRFFLSPEPAESKLGYCSPHSFTNPQFSNFQNSQHGSGSRNSRNLIFTTYSHESTKLNEFWWRFFCNLLTVASSRIGVPSILFVTNYYGCQMRKSPSLHSWKSTSIPKFCWPNRPNCSDFFDICLHWVSVVRVFCHIMSVHKNQSKFQNNVGRHSIF